MQIRKYVQSFYKYILVLITYCSVFIITAYNSHMSGSNFNSYIISCFGGCPHKNDFDILEYIMWIIPNFIMLFCFATVMTDDCEINYVYVFTRLKKKSIWLSKKVLVLFLNIFILYLVLFLCSIIIAISYNLPFNYSNLKATISSMVSMFFLNVLSIFVLSYIQNFISLKFGLTQSFIVTIAFYLFSILLVNFLFNKSNVLNIILFCLIPTNQNYIIHENSLEGTAHLTGFSQLFSYAFLIMLSAVSYVVSRVIFKKSDLTEMIKEI